MKSPSHTPATRINESLTQNNAGRFETQRKSGHSWHGDRGRNMVRRTGAQSI